MVTENKYTKQLIIVLTVNKQITYFICMSNLETTNLRHRATLVLKTNKESHCGAVVKMLA